MAYFIYLDIDMKCRLDFDRPTDSGGPKNFRSSGDPPIGMAYWWSLGGVSYHRGIPR